MTEALDMSLDDIIKNNKKSTAAAASRSRGGGGGGGRNRGRGSSESGVGPTRRIDNKPPVRTNPYNVTPHVTYVPQAVHVPKMMFGRDAITTSSEGGAKLYVSNLDYEVTNEDIKVLFSDVGELKKYSIHYDKSGRSKGTAEVVYVRHPDAVSAMKRYNNVQLDGKPMRLELVGVNIVTPVPVPVPPMHTRILGKPMNSSRISVNPSRSTQGRVVGRGQDRGGNDVQRGSGKSRARPKKLSAEDLDADLEKYRLEAMHIN